MKNTSRRNSQNNSKTSKSTAKPVEAHQLTKEEQFEAEFEKASAAASKKKEQQTTKVREVIYRVKTKRDAGVLMAFITFNYRVFHPNVTKRMLFYAILLAVPGFIVKPIWAKIIFFVLGALTVLLAFTRQYISLAMTKSNDMDYKMGTDFTYDFTSNDASIYRNEQLSSFAKYKDLTSFYYDDEYYYLVFKNHEFHILPKNRFIKGDAANFEDFLYKKSHKTCKWIPNKLKDKIAKRRASRNFID